MSGPAGLTVAVAAPADDAGIRALLRRQPLPGRVTLAFEREPRFALGCAVTGARHTVLVARDDTGDVVGVACRSVRQVHVNGSPREIGYLGQLRVDERFRGRWLVARGFAQLAALDRADPMPAYLAAIVDGSDEAAGVLVRRRRPSFPRFHAIARCRTLALPVRRGARRSRGEALPCTDDGIPALAAFLQETGRRRQLSPVWTADGIRALAPLGLRPSDVLVARDGRGITGAIAVWDQTAYKQSVVRGYTGWLRPASWLGGALVPRIGSTVPSAYAAMIAVRDDDPVRIHALLGDACALAAARDLDYLVVGLDERDPLLAAVAAYPHIPYLSRLYLASWPNGVSLHEQLDDRPTAVEVATL